MIGYSFREIEFGMVIGALFVILLWYTHSCVARFLATRKDIEEAP